MAPITSPIQIRYDRRYLGASMYVPNIVNGIPTLTIAIRKFTGTYEHVLLADINDIIVIHISYTSKCEVHKVSPVGRLVRLPKDEERAIVEMFTDWEVNE